MPSIIERLNTKLNSINEEINTQDLINPNSSNYDRQYAEDVLYHTIGPLLDAPRWSSGKWTSHSNYPPPPGFTPGGPAYKWTEEEIVVAMAGDPNLFMKAGAKDNPRSPAFGDKGGAPIYRFAKRLARKGNRERTDLIYELYSLGLAQLSRMMKPGYDEARSPFISYTMPTINYAMQNGLGGSKQGIMATGEKSTTGLIGLKSLMKTTSPEEAREIAGQVKGKYQTSKFHDKHPDNPFGPYSSRVHEAATSLAAALEENNPEQIDKVKNRIAQLIDEIDDEETFIPGATTGADQAISTPDRVKVDPETGKRVNPLKLKSMDVSADEEKGSMAGNIPTYQDEPENETGIDPEAVYEVIDIALGHDLTQWFIDDPELAAHAASNDKWKYTPGEPVTKMTVNEMRYLIRSLGAIAKEYPGKGRLRKAHATIAREAKNWCQPGEDPEIDVIPGTNGAIWKSEWVRNPSPEPMAPTPIAQEMTRETISCNKLNIKTARDMSKKAPGAEVISKAAVSAALGKAQLKLFAIFYAQRKERGLDESENPTSGRLFLENYDPVDRSILCETADWMIRMIDRSFNEDTSHCEYVRKPKKKPAIAWSFKRKQE